MLHDAVDASNGVRCISRVFISQQCMKLVYILFSTQGAGHVHRMLARIVQDVSTGAVTTHGLCPF